MKNEKAGSKHVWNTIWEANQKGELCGYPCRWLKSKEGYRKSDDQALKELLASGRVRSVGGAGKFSGGYFIPEALRAVNLAELREAWSNQAARVLDDILKLQCKMDALHKTRAEFLDACGHTKPPADLDYYVDNEDDAKEALIRVRKENGLE